MAVERATPDTQVTEAEKHVLDWDHIYLDLAPRIYNYFRYRLGRERDVEDLTSRAHGTVQLIGEEPANVTYSEFLTMLQVEGFTAAESGGLVRVIPELIVRQSALPLVSGAATRCSVGYRRCLLGGPMLGCGRAPVNSAMSRGRPRSTGSSQP
jgi:hypothetical protein